jgi:hypothetical protein
VKAWLGREFKEFKEVQKCDEIPQCSKSHILNLTWFPHLPLENEDTGA